VPHGSLQNDGHRLEQEMEEIINRLGIILLSIWLILNGVVNLFSVHLPAGDVILPALAIVTGIVILANPRKSRLSGRLAIWALALFLILSGLLSLVSIHFPAGGQIVALLAVAAGVLLLIER
jgi:hypothetical protein